MLVIRKASLNDIHLLRSLAREIWITCYPGIISMEQIEYMLKLMYSAKNIEKEIKEGIIWELVEHEGIPIGFIALTCTGDGVVKLNKLYLKKTTHGKGLGQECLKHVIDFATHHKFHKVYLTVNKGNEAAIKAYEKAGFLKTDSVVNDIGAGFVMDDYIYTLSIK